MKQIAPAEQELAAKYFTVSDTGLLTIDLEKLCNQSIAQMYDRVNSDYENELGIGLGAELRDWKKMVKKELHPDLVDVWELNKVRFVEFIKPKNG